MPTWMTPRRLGTAAALYAVFIGGWYLGQPLPQVGCNPSGPVSASESPVEVGEPGDVSGDISRVYRNVEGVVTMQVFSSAVIAPCAPETPRPRLVAWLTGDWR
ncbi:hypothetical protein [Streptomyces clavuligerus]|uniref:Putative secreted protein n=1 Tax=Streptomyces clavuligerus TaxID=1901 RepID=Q6TMW3_STRCL|nr:hypothetical protein [Streptomyces clavuligerus]AAQ93509.1 putative secreted protein [Streptomyces clavuligerus]EDY48812.1 conserved hypothetical protein [Streptomyces clavuligerus]MBY6300920.1 hypothetical protein [Streptomyces clavuligerus]WDN55730.1 hypothetical protein LL058_27920 [Streptomyces clavuligerus]WDN56453.1 hypothetical protein LL058_31945 [Streptomyces clavuligerus]